GFFFLRLLVLGGWVAAASQAFRASLFSFGWFGGTTVFGAASCGSGASGSGGVGQALAFSVSYSASLSGQAPCTSVGRGYSGSWSICRIKLIGRCVWSRRSLSPMRVSLSSKVVTLSVTVGISPSIPGRREIVRLVRCTSLRPDRTMYFLSSSTVLGLNCMRTRQ